MILVLLLFWADWTVTQRAKIVEKVHKHPLWDFSRCLGEKGRSCIKRKRILKILYFLHVLPFSPWDPQFKPTCSHFTEMLE